MRVNFSDVSIMGVVTTLISLGAAGYTYFKGKKTRSEIEAAKSRIDDAKEELKKDQDRRLRQFDRTIEDLEEAMEDGIDVNLAQDAIDKIYYDVASKTIEKQTAVVRQMVMKDIHDELENTVRESVDNAKDKLEDWTEDEIKKQVKHIDIHQIEKRVERTVTEGIRQDLKEFERDCERDFKDVVATKKKLLDAYGDNASEVYELHKNINEKIASK